jgi:fused signal recognition particle receptor
MRLIYQISFSPMFKKFLKSKTDVVAGSEPQSWLSKLKDGMSKTRQQLTAGFDDFLFGRKVIDRNMLDELETHLLLTDMGAATVDKILEEVRASAARGELSSRDALAGLMRSSLLKLLEPVAKPLEVVAKHPFVILMIGVNGVGKTTTIAKIANFLKQQGKSVMLAAGDTFRAAAVEQLTVWGERNGVPVVAQHTGSDSASVIYDALESAKAKNIDVLIADTAGRLHTQGHLMEELAKVRRVMSRLSVDAPHEVMLVLDATMGQNALVQAREFHEKIKLDSITLTKLDGTAKGGIVFPIANELQLPIRFIGVGENLDDLRPFVAAEFVDAIIG